MTDTVTFTLAKPIEHNGKSFSEFTFEEATAGDLAAADIVQGELNKTLAVFASMAGVPIQVMRKIKAKDLGRLSLEVAPLLGEQTPRPEDGEE